MFKSSSLLWAFFLGAQILTMLPHAAAQDAPLFIQGGLEGAVATDDAYNTGGTISINGFDMVVPKNMLVQFPAAYVPWKDFAAEVDSLLGYEVNVS